MVKAEIKWEGGFAFEALSGSGHTFLMDASEATGGTDRGPRPTEVALAAAGGCSGMDVVSVLGKMQVPFETLTMELEAERASEHPKVFTSILIVYKLTGEDVPAEKAHRAIQLSLDKYCTISNMLNKTATIDYRLEINGQVAPR